MSFRRALADALVALALGGLAACADDAAPRERGKSRSSEPASPSEPSSPASKVSPPASSVSGGKSPAPPSSSEPGDAKRSTCEAYADLIVGCCNPPVAQCGADRREGWVNFCVKGYEACQAAYDCLASATCETMDSCPNFGSGCQ